MLEIKQQCSPVLNDQYNTYLRLPKAGAAPMFLTVQDIKYDNRTVLGDYLTITANFAYIL